ncbi:MAG: DJ-1/PfpI family protein, partial [Planctomycetota bacterium]
MRTALLALLLLALPATAQMRSPHALDREHPPLVLDGHDPVALHAGRSEAGQAELAARHAGLEYRFTSAENRAAFLREPERYALAHGGRCPVCRTVLGDPACYRLLDGRLWLGCGEMCLELFAERPALFLAALERTVHVAVLVFPGVQILDFSGPYDVFAAAGFEVFTVAAERAPLVTGGGLTVLPAYSFSDAPPAEIVVIPG